MPQFPLLIGGRNVPDEVIQSSRNEIFNVQKARIQQAGPGMGKVLTEYRECVLPPVQTEHFECMYSVYHRLQTMMTTVDPPYLWSHHLQS